MQPHQSITDSVLASMVLLPLLRTDSTPSSKFVDTRDFDFVDFLIMVGATDGTLNAKAQESANADGSSPTDVSGAAITPITASGDNRVAVISVRKETLTKRYLGVLGTITVSSTGVNVAILAIRYRKVGNTPVTQEAAGANSYITGEVVKV